MKRFLLLALLAPAAQAAAPTPLSLTGSTWTLTQIAPRGTAIAPGERLRKPTLKILPGGILTGSTGCNGFSGRVSLEGQTMKVKPLKLSGTGQCTDRALSLEADFINLLESARRFEISGQNLKIYGAGNRFLTFQASREEQSVTASLPNLASIDGHWQLTQLFYANQLLPVPAQAAFSFQSLKSGVEVRGSAGCNQLFGKVTLEGRNLSVSDLGLTRMLCEDMQAEHAVVDILSLPLNVTESHGQLKLRNRKGELTLTRAVPAPSVPTAMDLQGRTFTLKAVAGQAVSGHRPITIRFDEGRVTGSDGCNTVNAKAEWRGQQLSVHELSSTRMSCPDMQGVLSLTEFLAQSLTTELTGKTLRLTANGVVWEFTASP